MRGTKAPKYRAGARPQPVDEANGRPTTMPAPYGGWNASGNLSNMPLTDAVVMDNIFPGVSDVGLRRGYSDFATGLPSASKCLMTFASGGVTKLFTSTETAVYNITAGGSVGAAEFSCLSGKWSWVNFSNAAGGFLVMVNGGDDLQVYDGTAWQALDGTSVPAFTGIAPSSLSKLSVHKKRLWFVEKLSMNLWYLPVDSFAGAAVRFPVGGLFAKGGHIADIATWTLDSGTGPEDYLVIMTTEGEVAVYAGTDPASASTWGLVGVYYVAIPLGDKPLVKLGGDLLALTELGLIPLSTYAQSTILDRSKIISDKIRGAFLDYSIAFKALSGWQTTIHASANALLVNVPVSLGTSVQFVMNLTTKAWCRFLGWNASYFLETSGTLYFASGTAIKQAWVGNSDGGSPITGIVQQAYNGLNYPGQKQITLLRPHISLDQALQISYYIDTDFKDFGGHTDVTYLLAGDTGVWDTSLWDSAKWSVGSIPLTPVWLTAPGQLGYLHSVRLRVVSSTSSFSWTATQLFSRTAGIL